MEAGLQIRKGGHLIETYWHYDEAKEEGSYLEREVTEQAPRLLFEACTLEADLKLRDIFLFLNTNLGIFDAILGNWCEEFVQEGLREIPPRANEEVEYLELYWLLAKNTDKKTKKTSIQGYLRPDFHGMGFVQPEDKYDGEGEHKWLECKKGDRINWGISFTAANELANLPIRLRPELTIYDEVDYKSTNQVMFDECDYSLGDILYGILWEISFFGGPEARDKKSAEMKDCVDRVKNGEAELVSMEDVFPESEK